MFCLGVAFIYCIVLFFDNPVIPKLLPFTFGDEPSYLGDSTTVQCSLSSGDTPVNFSWRLNGRRLQNLEGISVVAVGKKTSVLSIDSLSEHHAGNYTCFAENKAGLTSHSAELVVKGTCYENILHVKFSFYFILNPRQRKLKTINP